MFLLLIAGITGCLYFLSLLCSVPFTLTAIADGCVLFFVYRWMIPDLTPTLTLPQKTTWLSLAIFTAGLALLTKNTLNSAEKHGGWDAWAMWNFHARYLCDPAHWQLLFKNEEYDHPDYPLGLPSILAFFQRLIPGNTELVVPFTLSLFSTICGPAILFSEFMKKNLLIASLSLFLFACNEFYVSSGASEYADTLLGLFFLCFLVSIEHAKENRKYTALAAAFLGCCIWTKNEGQILASMGALFYARHLFLSGNMRHAFAGLALPLIAFIAFKMTNHFPNDLVSSLGPRTYQMITDKSRYQQIYASFINNLKSHFPYLKYLFFLYIVMCLLRRKWPERSLLLVLTCLLAYMLIYVITPYGLDWHLETSQNRLMVQLMPALVYAFALKFTRKKPGVY